MGRLNDTTLAIADSVYYASHVGLIAPLTVLGLLPSPKVPQPKQQNYVVVTGASTGIGRGAAQELHKLGYSVFAGVRKQADAESVKKDGLIPLIIDVADPASVEKALSEVKRVLADASRTTNQPHQLVGVFANAGSGGQVGPLEAADMKKLQALFDVNVFGVVRTIKTFLPLLRQSTVGARIIINGSVAGLMGQSHFIPYNMSKFAVEGLADGLRRELLSFGIPVAILEPGPVETSIFGKMDLGTYKTGAPSSEQTAIHQTYSKGWSTLLKMFENLTKTTVSTKFTSGAVIHAMTSRWPLSRYPVTWQAYAATSIMCKLPAHVVDALMYKVEMLIGSSEEKKKA